MSDPREALARLVEARKKATPPDWYVLDSRDEGGQTGSFNVLIGDQDDRVCEVHVGECEGYEEGNARFICEAANANLEAILAELDGLVEEVNRYRDLATQADRKHEQNTIRVDFLEGGGGMLLQASNNFNEKDLADLFAATYHCLVQTERCIFGAEDQPPGAAGE